MTVGGQQAVQTGGSLGRGEKGRGEKGRGEKRREERERGTLVLFALQIFSGVLTDWQ